MKFLTRSAGVDNKRRSLVRHSLIGAFSVATTPAAQAANLFAVDADDLPALAIKVTGALPDRINQQAAAALTRHLADVNLSDQDALTSVLALLHHSDLAQGRTYDLHLVTFSLTQIGVLVGLTRRSTR